MKTINKLGKKLWYYIAIGAGVLVLAAAVVTTVLILSKDDPFVEKPTNPPTTTPTTNPPTDEPDDPVLSTDTYIFPVEGATVLHSYGFYYNKTLGSYYEHQGIDFAAESGTSVYAIADGTVESVYVEDILRGGEITVLHEDGVKSVYTFVDAKDIKVGDKVKQGDVIGTVSEAKGEEYKDGAHLHLEVFAGDKTVDPESILPFDEK